VELTCLIIVACSTAFPHVASYIFRRQTHTLLPYRSSSVDWTSTTHLKDPAVAVTTHLLDPSKADHAVERDPAHLIYSPPIGPESTPLRPISYVRNFPLSSLPYTGAPQISPVQPMTPFIPYGRQSTWRSQDSHITMPAIQEEAPASPGSEATTTFTSWSVPQLGQAALMRITPLRFGLRGAITKKVEWRISGHTDHGTVVGETPEQTW
jgi:hypothetical protein